MQDGGLVITRNVIKDSEKKARKIEYLCRFKILKKGATISLV